MYKFALDEAHGYDDAPQFEYFDTIVDDEKNVSTCSKGMETPAELHAETVFVAQPKITGTQLMVNVIHALYPTGYEKDAVRRN